MALGWKFLIPLSLGNLALIAGFALWGKTGLQLLGVLLTGFVAVLGVVAWRRPPKPRLSEQMAAPAEVAEVRP